jgi:hypothetical protein
VFVNPNNQDQVIAARDNAFDIFETSSESWATHMDFTPVAASGVSPIVPLRTNEILSAGDNFVTLWRADSHQWRQIARSAGKGDYRDYVDTLAYSPLLNEVAVGAYITSRGGDNSHLDILGYPTMNLIERIRISLVTESLAKKMLAVDYNSAGNLLACARGDGVVVVFDRQGDRKLAQFSVGGSSDLQRGSGEFQLKWLQGWPDLLVTYDILHSGVKVWKVSQGRSNH